MNPEERELLESIRKLTEENNEIIKSLRRIHRWGSFWSVFRWALIIGSALGAYYYLQPYVDKILELYSALPDFQNFLPR